MAFPFLAVIIAIVAVVLIAWKFDIVWKIAVQFAFGLGLGILLTMGVYLVVRIPDNVITWMVFIFATLFVIIRLMTTPRNPAMQR